IYGAGAPLVFAAELATGIGSAEGELPQPQPVLLENYPNPFNAGTRISWQITEAGLDSKTGYSLSIYDILGRKVRFLPVNKKSGRGEAFWDGRDDTATAVSGGVYLIILEGGGQRLVRKVLLLR
ncbi:MAG TPA: T9SS type A sorting domain-containing protein, partial [bacterium]|nr:T9SS type A sorting domain-containing protein [bacterium]